MEIIIKIILFIPNLLYKYYRLHLDEFDPYDTNMISEYIHLLEEKRRK